MASILFRLPISILTLASCSAEKHASKSALIYDQQLGASEKQIVAKYGTPAETRTVRAAEMKDELRAPLSKRVPNENTQIKELYYNGTNGEKNFWLIKGNDGSWKGGTSKFSTRVEAMNLSAASPSPLNGERAGVRGEAVRLVFECLAAHG